jgi:hypothetical protein
MRRLWMPRVEPSCGHGTLTATIQAGTFLRELLDSYDYGNAVGEILG